MHKQIVRVLSGLQGSGKSTYAERLVNQDRLPWQRINYDCLRHYDKAGQPVEYRFNREAEDRIQKEAFELAERALRLGMNLVIDNTNLTDKARQPWYNLADNFGASYEVVEFNTNLDTCIFRNEMRTGWAKVPRPVIERAALFNHKIVWPADQKVVIVDMDGTLADSSGRTKYVNGICFHGGQETCLYCKGTGKQKKDWKAFYAGVGNDAPRIPVREWVKQLYADGRFYICVVSGRPIDQAGNATIAWLDKQNVPYDRIFMRNSGDFRPDTIIKREILCKIRAHIEVAFAIDDRPSVVRMWRDNDVTCYDVGDGKEF